MRLYVRLPTCPSMCFISANSKVTSVTYILFVLSIWHTFKFFWKKKCAFDVYQSILNGIRHRAQVQFCEQREAVYSSQAGYPHSVHVSYSETLHHIYDSYNDRTKI